MSKTNEKKGNLTGIPRIIKDNCAVVFNCIQKWNSLVIKGVEVLRQIAEFKAQIVDTSDGVMCLPTEESHVNKLLNYSEILCTVYDDLSENLNKMKKVEDQLGAVCKLKETQSEHVLFETWPATKFYDTVKAICEDYTKELAVKKSIKEEFAFLTTNDQMTFFVTLWSHQVYITDSNNMLLECLLVETGFH